MGYQEHFTEEDSDSQEKFAASFSDIDAEHRGDEFYELVSDLKKFLISALKSISKRINRKMVQWLSGIGLLFVFFVFFFLSGESNSGESILVSTQTSTPTKSSTPTLTVTPSPSITPSLATKVIGCVTSFQLSVRAGPGIEYALAGGLVKDQCIQLHAVSIDLAWAYIEEPDCKGWISIKYLIIDGYLSVLPTIGND